MKQTKQMLAFEQLEAEMELLSFRAMFVLKGGNSGYYSSDPGYCVFDCLSYLSESYSITGYSYSPQYFYDLYASQHNSSDFSYNSSGELMGVSINTDSLLNLMSGYFNGSSIAPSDLNAVLSSGTKVMASLPNQGPNGEGHAIIIECYNGDGRYKTYNPSTGDTEYYTGGELADTNILIAIN